MNKDKVETPSVVSLEEIEAVLRQNYVRLMEGQFVAVAIDIYTLSIQRLRLEREKLARILDVALDRANPWIPPKYRPDTAALADAILAQLEADIAEATVSTLSGDLTVPGPMKDVEPWPADRFVYACEKRPGKPPHPHGPGGECLGVTP